MKFVLVRLQISKLSKLFATIIKLASEWLDLLMDNLVCANVASLRKGFATNVTTIRSFSRVSPLMRLEIS